ncbi:MAG: Ldh family oxidoreductase, partial [Pseudomonadales bacterium]
MTTILAAGELRRFVTAIFEQTGASAEVAGAVADHLVEANLKGHDSHGVGMIPAYVANIRAGHLDVAAHGRVTRDCGAVLLVDGAMGFGQVIGREATDLALERVRSTGVVCVGVRNCH